MKTSLEKYAAGEAAGLFFMCDMDWILIIYLTTFDDGIRFKSIKAT